VALGALAVTIVGACLLTASTWHVYSHTWDEPEHLAAGVELLDRGLYEYDTEHPPIARVLIALGPYLAGAHSFGTSPPDGTWEGRDILYTGRHYDRFLTLARLGTLPFLALLLAATWLWAARLFAGALARLLAVALLASIPPVLGHAGLATLDVAAAATILLALYALESWLESASSRDALFFGLATGVAVGTKFSAVPFIALSLLALSLAHWAVRRRVVSAAGQAPAAPGAASTLRARVAGLAIVALAALVPLALAYGLRAPNAARVAQRFNWAVSYLLQQGGVDHELGVLFAHLTWLLPRALRDLASGMVAVKAHNDTGHLSYLLGEVRTDGWWYFYLVALAVKTPLPVLVAGPVGLVGLARGGWRNRSVWPLAPALLLLTLLVFASTFSHINIGIRHVLILYPFLALGAAWTVARAARALRCARDRRLAAAGTVILGALLAWQFSSLVTAYPDYLPYFNEAVAHPERVLVDSDLDWGQDLKRLERRAAELGIARLSLAYRGTADLTQEPLPPLAILPPHQPAHGWVAIFALARTRDPGDYAWLDAYRPVERIGRSIDLYYIP
jgi:4-amino-4-deoxy-L-arabinose transferase-like glycosyltransferase